LHAELGKREVPKRGDEKERGKKKDGKVDRVKAALARLDAVRARRGAWPSASAEERKRLGRIQSLGAAGDGNVSAADPKVTQLLSSAAAQVFARSGSGPVDRAISLSELNVAKELRHGRSILENFHSRNDFYVNNAMMWKLAAITDDDANVKEGAETAFDEFVAGLDAAEKEYARQDAEIRRVRALEMELVCILALRERHDAVAAAVQKAAAKSKIAPAYQPVSIDLHASSHVDKFSFATAAFLLQQSRLREIDGQLKAKEH
jgi:hypothetical protein